MADLLKRIALVLRTCAVAGCASAACHPARPIASAPLLSAMVDSLNGIVAFKCLAEVGYPPVGTYPFTGCKARIAEREYYYYRDSKDVVVAIGERIDVSDDRLNSVEGCCQVVV